MLNQRSFFHLTPAGHWWAGTGRKPVPLLLSLRSTTCLRRAALLLCLALAAACARGPTPAIDWRDTSRALPNAGSPLLLERLGNKYFEDGQYESAARRFEAVLAQRPGHALAGLRLGLCRWLSGRPDLAAQLWEGFAPALTELGPEFRRLAAGLGLLEYRLQAVRAAGDGRPDLRLGRVALLPPGGSLAQGPQGKALHHLAVAALRREFGINAVPRERVRAFLDEAGAVRGEDLDRAAALGLAGRMGAEHAVLWRMEPAPENGAADLVMTLLCVESAAGRAVRLGEELAAERGRLVSIEGGLLAANKELDALDAAMAHHALSEQMDRLLAERAPRAEEISELLRQGRTKEARQALEELKALESEIEQVYERQLVFRRTAFELFLGLYRPSAEHLRTRREDAARRAADLEAKARAARERAAALQRELDDPIPAGGRELRASIPAAGLFLARVPHRAAGLLAGALGRQPAPGLPPDRSVAGDPLGLAALDALGRALAAMDNAEYGAAKELFPAALALEPAPPALPWPGFDPLALSRVLPEEVAAAFTARFMAAVEVLRREHASRGGADAEFADLLGGR